MHPELIFFSVYLKPLVTLLLWLLHLFLVEFYSDFFFNFCIILYSLSRVLRFLMLLNHIYINFVRIFFSLNKLLYFRYVPKCICSYIYENKSKWEKKINQKKEKQITELILLYCNCCKASSWKNNWVNMKGVRAVRVHQENNK